MANPPFRRNKQGITPVDSLRNARKQFGAGHAAEVNPVLLPPKSPNCNAHLERFFRSLKDEALSRIILFGETALREAVTEYVSHYHGERAHQGLDHQILLPGPEANQQTGEIVCRERLGGLLKYYHRQAA